MSELPKTRKTVKPGDPCVQCGRGMRPSGCKRPENAGFPQHAAKGLCRTCYNGRRESAVKVVRPARVDPALARLPRGWFAKSKPVVPRKRQLSAETAMESVERVGPTDPAVVEAARRLVVGRAGEDAGMLLAMLGIEAS